jgi:hypothetical protein
MQAIAAEFNYFSRDLRAPANDRDAALWFDMHSRKMPFEVDVRARHTRKKI